jgi:alpha-galactosidase
LKHWLLFVAVFAAARLGANAQKQETLLAPTPPMGWNSWDSYGLTVTEAEFKANVSWFHQHLQPSGWQYVVVDEGWYLDHPGAKGDGQGFNVSPDGRYLPAAGRFPSSAGGAGLEPLADYAHSLGLKFGIHIIRGIPRKAVDQNLPIANSSFHAADAADTSDRCRWNSDNYGLKDNAAAQAYYDSIAKLYAGWGVDFLKVDCISQPYKAAEIHMMSAALKRSGRPIVLSLSPGPTPLDEADDVRKYAQLWRISDDMWDVWSKSGTEGFPQSITGQMTLLANWAPHVAPGHWPDADMLPIGYLGPRPGWGEARQSRFTADETRSLLTLWCIARSPLILGANLTRIDGATEALLTNREALAVDQHSTGNHAVVQTPDTVVWRAKLDGGGEAVAVFNLTGKTATVTYPWTALGLERSSYRVRDLWERKDQGSQVGLSVQLGPHASALFAVR